MEFFYCSCGNEIESARHKLGYYICTECGEERAKLLKQRLAKSIVPAYNKGAYMLITDKKQLLQLDPKHK